MSASAEAWKKHRAENDGAPERDVSLESGSHIVSTDPRRARIRAAMEPGAMNIVFQPVVDLRRGAIAGAEALARFVAEPSRTPDVWFGEAWDVGLGVELELHAIRRALASLPRLPEGAHMAINASPQTLVSPLLDAILDDVPGHRVIVELTEHAQVDDYRDVQAAIARLRARGVRLAIDDCGAGFSSLQHILHLRPDLIKLDRSLTQGIDADPVRYALAAALVTFAMSLDAQICAEGIEKDAELAALQHLGIAYGQGYFLGRPLPLPLTPPPKGVWLSEHSASVQHERVPARSLRPAPLRATLKGGEAETRAVHEDLQAPVSAEPFDRVTRWACGLLRAPMATFTALTEQSSRVTSAVGLPYDDAPRRAAQASEELARLVVAASGPVAVPDAEEHRVGGGSAAALGAVAYLGVPFRGPGGSVLGVLAVMDVARRFWTVEDQSTLVELASSLANELELRALRRGGTDDPPGG